MSKAWELMTFYDKVLIVIIAIISLSFILFPNSILNHNNKEDEYIIGKVREFRIRTDTHGEVKERLLQELILQ